MFFLVSLISQTFCLCIGHVVQPSLRPFLVVLQCEARVLSAQVASILCFADVDLTLLAANPPQSHISSFNLELLKHADMIKALNLTLCMLHTLTLNDTK